MPDGRVFWAYNDRSPDGMYLVSSDRFKVLWQRIKSYLSSPGVVGHRKAYYALHRQAILEKQREYNRMHRGHRGCAARAYVTKNRLHVRDWHRAYMAARRNQDIGFRLAGCLRSRIRRAMRLAKTQGCLKSEGLIGCSIEFFRKYIEKKFSTGMTWSNYGRSPECWSIDHVKPCASFDLTDPAQQLACFHYTNCQPMWHLDNIRKGDKLSA